MEKILKCGCIQDKQNIYTDIIKQCPKHKAEELAKIESFMRSKGVRI